MPNLAQAFDVLYRIVDKEWKNFLNFPGSIAKNQKSVILKIKFDNIRKKVVCMKKLLAMFMAFALTFQLVTPVFAEEIEETQAATETMEVETEAPVTEVPTTEPTTTDAMETAAPEETSAPTEPQTTTEVTEATASTEETIATTEPTEETTEPALDLLAEEENVIASGTCGAQGDNLTWVLTGDGTLTISGNGKMKNYENAANEPYTTKIAPWYKYNKNTEIRLVVVETGVTSIGDFAFSGCDNLTSVVLPDSIDSIGSRIFSDCILLKSILVSEENAYYASVDGVLFNKELTKLIAYPSNNRFSFAGDIWNITYQIPTGVTSIGDYAFEDAYLHIMVIPDSVIDIGEGAFMSGWLTSITLPENITSIGDSAFRYCGLTSIVIPESVTRIGSSAFEGCGSLTSITIPKRVTSIGDSAFWGCDDLTSVTIPGSVTSISDYAFWGCSSLTNVTIGEGVTSIGGEAFYGCSSLSSLKIPESVTQIESGAFQSSNLTNVEIPQNVVSIGDYAFSNCSSLTSFSVDERNAHYTAVDGVLLSKNRKELVVYPGGKEENIYKMSVGVTKVHAVAFHGCGNLTQIVLSGNVTSIGDGAFVSCDILTSVVIPKSVTSIGDSAFWGCDSLTDIYYGGSQRAWKKIKMGYNDFNGITIHYNSSIESPSVIEIRPVDTTALTSGGKLTLTAWAMPDNKKVKANWSLSEDSKAYATISSSGVLTAKTVSEVQNITVIATPTDGSPEARKEIQILPKITVKQTEKFNLFYGNGRAKLAITGGQVASARFVEPSDFVLDNNDGQFYIRLAEGASVKPKTKVTLEITLPGCDIPVRQSLTIATTNTAPKLKLNPTASIVNTTLTESLTVETAILGTEDTLTVRSATKGVTASVDKGILNLTLDTGKTTTATVYLKGSDWAKEIRLTHRITVTDKKPTVKLSAKGKLDVLNPASEIVYTPKLTNATGTIESVRLEGADGDFFDAKVDDNGIIHLKLAKSGENYATKKTYKVTPVVILLGKEITGPTLSVKVTQSTLKLAKIPNQTVYQSQTAPLAVKLTVTSPANAKIGDVQLNAKTTAALRNALENAGGIQADEANVSFPASAFATLKPGRYTVILDVTPSNAASDTKPIQARFTLTVRK